MVPVGKFLVRVLLRVLFKLVSIEIGYSYTFLAVMGIPLSKKKKLPSGSFFFVCTRREARPLRGVRVGFEGSGLPARPSPNLLTAAAARQLRAPPARVRGSN